MRAWACSLGPRERGAAPAAYKRFAQRNLDAGRIHFARADQKMRGPRAAEPAGAHDHAMDDIRYFVMSLEKEPPVAAVSVERRRF